MVSTRAGIDIIQILILIENGMKKETITKVLKSLNSSGSIEILKSLRSQTTILRGYAEQFLAERQSKFIHMNKEAFIQRQTRQSRMIDYAFSNYIYKGNYECFRIEDYTDGIDEQDIIENVKFSFSLGIINSNKTEEQVISEILARIESVKTITDMPSNGPRKRGVFVAELMDGSVVSTGVTAGATKQLLDLQYTLLTYKEAETNYDINVNADYILKVYKDDFENLLPIVGMKALGYNSNKQFGFNREIYFNDEMPNALSSTTGIIVNKIFHLAVNNAEYLESLYLLLNEIISAPKEMTTYLGKNITNLNRGSDYVLIDAYKTQMNRLKSAKPDKVSTLSEVILADCDSLINEKKIEKVSFKRDGIQTTEEISKAVSDTLTEEEKLEYRIVLTEEDKQYYYRNLNSIESKNRCNKDLTETLHNQQAFIHKLMECRTINSGGECSLPKSVMTLLKLYSLINKDNTGFREIETDIYTDNLDFYNHYFKVDLTLDDWYNISQRLLQDLTIVFCGFDAVELLKNYTTITCAVSQEVFEEVQINTSVSTMAVKLSRSVDSFRWMNYILTGNKKE